MNSSKVCTYVGQWELHGRNCIGSILHSISNAFPSTSCIVICTNNNLYPQMYPNWVQKWLTDTPSELLNPSCCQSGDVPNQCRVILYLSYTAETLDIAALSVCAKKNGHVSPFCWSEDPLGKRLSNRPHAYYGYIVASWAFNTTNWTRTGEILINRTHRFTDTD